jgi:hypothetical protein
MEVTGQKRGSRDWNHQSYYANPRQKGLPIAPSLSR